MSKRKKITDYIGPTPISTNGNGENLHHHVFLAVDHNRSIEQEGYDTQIRDHIVDLVSSSWNSVVTNESLPKLTEFRCETINNCFRKLKLHFSNVESRISVEATPGTRIHRGHHPFFSFLILHRQNDLDPTMFTKVPSFEFLNLDGGSFMPALTHEMQHNNNRRLENFLIFNIDENSKVYEVLPEENEGNLMTRNRFVFSKGLTFHELIVLYFTCSTRRCLVEVNWKALEDVFCYIYPPDLKELIKAMDNFITDNGLHFHRELNENQFFDRYMSSFFHMMLDPVEEGDVNWYHEVLNEE